MSTNSKEFPKLMFYLINLIDLDSLDSIGVRYRAGSRDEMRWSLYIKGQWITGMPADHPVAPTQGLMKWNETKWTRWVSKLWNEMCGRGRQEKNLLRTPFRPTRSRPRWSSGYHFRPFTRGLRVQTRPGSMDFFSERKIPEYDFLRKGSKAGRPVSARKRTSSRN